MSHTIRRRELPAAEQTELATRLGVADSTAQPVTWGSLAGEVDSVHDSTFTAAGETIRADLGDRLDAELLERERDRLETALDRLPDVRDVGVPDGPDSDYAALTEPGWRVYDHLVETRFFTALDDQLPRFSERHIEHTARKLLLTEPLATELDAIGFDETEKTWLLSSVANNATRLARWVPTNQIPDGVEYDVSNVPALHRRAAGGALLWIDGLDRHLWQYEPLVTEEILDDAAWYTKALLGGLYVLTTAAHDVATGGDRFSDGQMTAALTASAAIEIVSQEDLMRDVFYITDDMRASSELR